MITSFCEEDELKNLGLKTYGKNVLISRNVRIYGADNISIGNDVRIDDFCILSGKIELHNNIHIAAACLLFGGDVGIVMNDFSTISSRCAIYAIGDDYSGNAMTNPMVPSKYRNVQDGRVILGRHAIVGTGSTILPGVRVGEGVSVGSMALVNKSLEQWGIYVGVPCKRVKDRSKKILDIEKIFLEERKNNAERE